MRNYAMAGGAWDSTSCCGGRVAGGMSRSWNSILPRTSVRARRGSPRRSRDMPPVGNRRGGRSASAEGPSYSSPRADGERGRPDASPRFLGGGGRGEGRTKGDGNSEGGRERMWAAAAGRGRIGRSARSGLLTREVAKAMSESPSSSESFGELIARVRAGDEQAAADLVRRYEPAIRRAARVRLVDTRLNRLL